MELETWRWRYGVDHGDGDMEMETWRWRRGDGDMEIETWRSRRGDGDMETWRHGDMETFFL
jgi:hypothetical protein